MTWESWYFGMLLAVALVDLGTELSHWRRMRQERRQRKRDWDEHVARGAAIAMSKRVPWRRP